MRQLGSLSRRQMLGRAMRFSAAFSVPAIVPAQALGLGGMVAANDRITVGMIGLGRQAVAYNLPFFLDASDAEVVALCDVDAWRLAMESPELAKTLGRQPRPQKLRSAKRYRDWREVVEHPGIDALMISTPDHWHVPMALAGVKAGKHVCCEKPLTRFIAEGRQLADAVAQAGVVFRTDSEFRSLEPFHRTVELVRNGLIGPLKRIFTGVPFGPDRSPPAVEMPVPEELDYEAWQGPAPRRPYCGDRVHPRHGYSRPGWMNILDYCDGMITNWGTHLNDIAQWGNNTDRTGPVEIEGSGEYTPAGGLWNVIRSFEVRYRYANDVELCYRTDRPYVRFEGTEGWIQADYPKGLTAEPISVLTAALPPEAVRFPLKPEKRDFLDAIKTGGSTLADAEVGHRTTSLCHLGHIAVHLGRKLRWDPVAERFTNCEEANRYLDRPILEPP